MFDYGCFTDCCNTSFCDMAGCGLRNGWGIVSAIHRSFYGINQKHGRNGCCETSPARSSRAIAAGESGGVCTAGPPGLGYWATPDLRARSRRAGRVDGDTPALAAALRNRSRVSRREGAIRGGESVLRLYGTEHFARITKGRKRIPRFTERKGLGRPAGFVKNVDKGVEKFS